MGEKRGVLLDLLRPAIFALVWVPWPSSGETLVAYLAKTMAAFLVFFYFAYVIAYYERLYVRCNRPLLPHASRLRCLGRVDVRGLLVVLTAVILLSSSVLERDVVYAVMLGAIFLTAVLWERNHDFAATRALLCFLDDRYVLVDSQDSETGC